MKTQIAFVLTFVLIVSIGIVSGLPQLPEYTYEQCLGCHADEEYGNTAIRHHLSPVADIDGCICHDLTVIYPIGVDWRSCDNCHIDFDHHEDASGQCDNCHEDKQRQNQNGK